MRVLVVEDEADLRFLHRVTLESVGHTVLEAADGSEAITAARTHELDLVLLDMMLPEVDGFGVLAALAADPRTEHLPVVIVSARVDAGDQLRGLRAGALAYVTKPFSVDEVQLLVAALGAMGPVERQASRQDAITRLDASGRPDATFT
jgi:CheY-like chemotaxis protein